MGGEGVVSIGVLNMCIYIYVYFVCVCNHGPHNYTHIQHIHIYICMFRIPMGKTPILEGLLLI